MRISFRYLAAIQLFLGLLFTACENDIERINLLTDETEIPKVKGANIQVIYSDSAKVKVQILSPSYRQFYKY